MFWRKLFLVFILSAAANTVSAQERGGIFSYYTGLFLPRHDAPKRLDRFFVDFHHATWQTLPQGVKTQPWSHSVSFSRLLDVPFGKSRFAFAFGPGVSIINVHNNARYLPVTDATTGNVLYSQFVPWDATQTWRRNKTASNIVYGAAELRFRTRRGRVIPPLQTEDHPSTRIRTKRPFRFYAGGIAGYQFNVQHVSQGRQGKFKEYNIRHLERLQYGVTAKVGWHRLTFSGTYMLTSMFRSNQGQDLRLMTFGLTFYVF
jgi:hypothetical protein